MDALLNRMIECLGADRVLVGEAVSERATSYWNSAPNPVGALAVVEAGAVLPYFNGAYMPPQPFVALSFTLCSRR